MEKNRVFTPERERGRVLLLNGPQHFDSRRPLTGELRRWAEHVEPLGIAIVAAYLRDAGFNVSWREMNPQNPEEALENPDSLKAVFISSRFFDSDLARKVIAKANKVKVPVVAGGYGPTFAPDKFKGAVLVNGEFEPVAEDVIDDLGKGNFEDIYDARNLPPHDIHNNYKWPNRSIFGKIKGLFSSLRRVPQEWQRGCYNHCSFCSPTRLQRGGSNGIRVRQVGDIIAEIEALGLGRGSYLFSTDLNTSAIPTEALRELFGYLQEKGIRWFTEGTIAPLIEDLEKNGENDSLLAKMSSLNGGGCYSFLYGADDLIENRVRGSFDKDVANLRGWIDIFQRFGIPLNLSVVVGLDNHIYPESFYTIRQVLEELNPPYTFLHLATPYPGTPWGDKVAKEDRLIEGRTSLDFNHRRVVHIPKRMAPEELQQGYYWLMRTVNSLENNLHSFTNNFDNRLWHKDPILGLLGTGLPWRMETWLTDKELKARGYLDSEIQTDLDKGYKDWLNRNS